MSQVDLNKLGELSKLLGLTGQDLVNFVKEQNEMYRDERAKEREEAQAAREFALANPPQPSPITEPSAKPIKLLPFREKDDLVSYLTRFERVAQVYNWDDNKKAVHLASLLQDRALTIYSTFEDDTTQSYVLLKAALLKSFKLNEEHYRKEFRHAKFATDCTFSQFAVDLKRKFDLWMESANVDKTYDAIRDKMICDQFISLVNLDLRTFIKEQSVSNLEDVVRCSDNFGVAHPNVYKQISQKTCSNSNRKPRSDDVTSSSSVKQNEQPTVKCFSCGDPGHKRNECPKRSNKVNFISNSLSCQENLGPMFHGTVNGMNVSTILRDTGCSCVVVSDKLFPDIECDKLDTAELSDYLGRKDTWPVVRCYIDCHLFKGWVNAVVAPIKYCAVLLGNIREVIANDEINVCETSSPQNQCSDSALINTECEVKAVNKSSDDAVAHAITRSAKPALHPLIVPSIEPLHIKKNDFVELQTNCESLSNVRNLTLSGDEMKSKSGRSYIFVRQNNLIYRKCIDSKISSEVGKLTLVVPKACRMLVLKLAHDLPIAGHFSHRKTEMKICDEFWWPGVSGDTKRYCRSCDQCQRMNICKRTRKAPLTSMPIISTPFERIAIDIVGKITPASGAGHQFILTVIDYATCFLEAVPLKEITSIAIAEALLSIFSRVGVPREIISDRGPQFTSELMSEIHRLIGIKPIFTTPYHPMMNGKLERQHATLKSVLRKLCENKPRDWDRYLVPTLFALRELPNDTTGFSPFELLYGRQVRGPLSILHELWSEPELSTETRSSYQYVVELRDRLEEASEIAVSSSKIKADTYKTYFDKKTSKRTFKVDDEALLLLPDSSNKLLMRWKGPYKVVGVRSNLNYILDIDGAHKTYHVNLLKKYVRRAVAGNINVIDEDPTLPFIGIENEQSVVQLCTIGDPDDNTEVYTLPHNDSETDYSVCENLNDSQSKDIKELLGNFSEILSDVPGCTGTLSHEIKLKTTDVICRRNYPIPLHLRPYFDDEINKMLDMGIIQPSNSEFCSPSVMVKKAGKSADEYRLTQDFRALNAITVFDAEPMPEIETDLHKFAGAKYISEIDITRAYYQVPLSKESRKYTAFCTSKGLMEYVRLPFGLVTACATYIRLMRKVLSDIDPVFAKYISVYFDNIYVATETFETHLQVLTQLLLCLKRHNLTARPGKCSFAFDSVKYLGFIVGRDCIQPQPDKVEAIVNMCLPKVKKELRSFLGFISFYRKFIPNMSSLTARLSDKLKNSSPDKLSWSVEDISAFETLKSHLTQSPILSLPNLNKKFCLRTDASGVGIAAVLCQYHDGVAKPVCFASRKLLQREINYSTIERECLALVWGITKFEFYLYGKEFIIETDHKPLTFLRTFKGSNPRLLRWALALQPYQFTVVHIPGSDNHGPDVLSRCL